MFLLCSIKWVPAIFHPSPVYDSALVGKMISLNSENISKKMCEYFLKKYDDDPDYRGIPAAEARVGRLLVMVIMVATVFPTLSHITILLLFSKFSSNCSDLKI